MRDIWVISDTHFFHENILKFKDSDGKPIRGSLFSSVEEMNETMVDNWNKVVQKGDIVYHLGDVFFGQKDEFIKLWKRLNGSKRLILGNHDDAKFFVKHELVQKILMWRMFTEFNVVLTHVPIHESALQRGKPGEEYTNPRNLLNIHGHTHQNGSPDGPYKSVCVEMVDYTPQPLEQLCMEVEE